MEGRAATVTYAERKAAEIDAAWLKDYKEPEKK
jgi:hypothetical protein